MIALAFCCKDAQISGKLLVALLLFFFGNGIQAVWPPGVALENALDAEPEAFDGSPNFDGFYHVVRTGRLEAAFGREERRDGFLVKAHR